MMSRTNFENIARIIKENDNKQEIINGLCIYFTAENERFNSELFKNACVPDLTELCPHCEQEVTIKAVKKVQTCPNCKKPIKPCSMCDMNIAKCNECPVHTTLGD